MDRRLVPALVRLGFALLTLGAIGVQLTDLASRGTLNPVNYFSQFTIQSNLIAVAAFLLTAARWRVSRSPAHELLRGGSAVYLTVTFVVFALLLSGTDADTAIPWVNTILHRVFPVVVLVDWLLASPAIAIPFARSLAWLVYPVIWAVYTMARGVLVGWFPYPFLDPAKGGLASVAVTLVAILGLAIVACALVAGLGRRGSWGGAAAGAS